jgi:galactose mutarotase-like enzyme
MFSISNEQITVNVNSKGAELCSMRTADGTEHIWQADPLFWNRHAPILFPVVGRLHEDRYQLDGNSYRLTQHGFARDMLFSLMEQSQSSLTFQLLPTEATRAAYPFEFSLTIRYRLTGTRLAIEYAVGNNGTSRMPFSIGTHPAFNLHHPIDEYALEFSQPETMTSYLLNDPGLLSHETGPTLENDTTLALSPTLFDRNALIFLDTKSDTLSLVAKKSRHRISVEFPGFPQLGIWSKPGAPFVCIEPWHGHTDPEQPYGDLWNKPALLTLEAGDSFSCTHWITIES